MRHRTTTNNEVQAVLRPAIQGSRRHSFQQMLPESAPGCGPPRSLLAEVKTRLKNKSTYLDSNYAFQWW